MDYKSLAIWAVSDDVGLSSICLARAMMGLECDGDYPHDGGDFGRCEKLLEAVPELRERLPEMANINPQWAAIVAHWDEIARTKKSDQHQLIRRILDQLQDTSPEDEVAL